MDRFLYSNLTFLMCMYCSQAAFSPDSAHILSGSTDGNVYIWQVSPFEPLQTWSIRFIINFE